MIIIINTLLFNLLSISEKAAVSLTLLLSSDKKKDNTKFFLSTGPHQHYYDFSVLSIFCVQVRVRGGEGGRGRGVLVCQWEEM